MPPSHSSTDYRSNHTPPGFFSPEKQQENTYFPPKGKNLIVGVAACIVLATVIPVLLKLAVAIIILASIAKFIAFCTGSENSGAPDCHPASQTM